MTNQITLSYPEALSITALLMEGRRQSGKKLLTAPMAKRHIESAPAGQLRFVLNDLTISFHGKRWDLSPTRFYPGDLVLCAPTRRGVYLQIQDPHKAQPSILVGQVSPLHNPRSNAHTPRNTQRSGRPTTCASAHSGSADHRQSKRKSPPQAKEQDSTPRHILGSELWGQVVNGIPIFPAHPMPPCILRCMQCIHKSPLP